MHINNELATIATSTNGDCVTVEKDRSYTVAHDRENSSHAPDTNTVYLALDDEDPDGDVGLNKFKLLSGRTVEICPGHSKIHFKSASGAPTISIAPSNRTSSAVRN
jgi:hypothetical protein